MAAAGMHQLPHYTTATDHIHLAQLGHTRAIGHRALVAGTTATGHIRVVAVGHSRLGARMKAQVPHNQVVHRKRAHRSQVVRRNLPEHHKAAAWAYPADMEAPSALDKLAKVDY